MTKTQTIIYKFTNWIDQKLNSSFHRQFTIEIWESNKRKSVMWFWIWMKWVTSSIPKWRVETKEGSETETKRNQRNSWTTHFFNGTSRRSRTTRSYFLFRCVFRFDATFWRRTFPIKNQIWWEMASFFFLWQDSRTVGVLKLKSNLGSNLEW